MRFEFATATRILFGPGTVAEAGPLAAALGKRAFVVTGGSSARAKPLLGALAAAKVEYTMFSVSGEPTTDTATRGTDVARETESDVVLGFGGGSALDTGKAIAALLTNGGSPLDYLEVVGEGKKLTVPTAPFIAIPTTAGTGAEVTRNAVLGSPEHGVKVSLRSPLLLPDFAVVDPELTLTLPPKTTAGTGLDALTQVIEPFVSSSPNPITDSLCREGMCRAGRSLQRAYENGSAREAREDMAIASLFGGLALANAKLGAVHGFAGPFGGMFPGPHGAVCAALLPHVMSVNVRALKDRTPLEEASRRYDEVARILTGNGTAVAEDGVHWVENLCETLRVPPLRSYGLAEGDFPALIEKASNASSMKGNPIALLPEEMWEILARAM